MLKRQSLGFGHLRKQKFRNGFKGILTHFPANIYNTNVKVVILVILFLTLNIFHTLF